jgi:copper chaperone NosL
MTGSDGRSAAQLVVPGQDPLFFDDIGCLRDYLRDRSSALPAAAAFVADHRTREWVPAERAVYTRHDAVKTPMSSHLVAHANLASRDADAVVTGGTAVTFADVFAGLTFGGVR